MGFMKLFEAAVKTVVVLPVAIVKDVVTGDFIVSDECSTERTVKSIKEDIDDIAD